MRNKQKAWRLGAAIIKGEGFNGRARGMKDVATVVGVMWRTRQGSSRHLSTPRALVAQATGYYAPRRVPPVLKYWPASVPFRDQLNGLSA